MLKKIIKVFIFLTVLILLFLIVPKTHLFQQHIFRRSLADPIPLSVEIIEYKKNHHNYAIKFSANIDDIKYIVDLKKI